jgi:hypothetical protein
MAVSREEASKTRFLQGVKQQNRNVYMRKFLVALCLVAGVAWAAIASSRAAVPSDTVKRWQDEAPDVVELTVLSIDETAAIRPWPGMEGRRGSVRTTNVTLTAKVDAVRRTSSNLEQSALIVVHYVMRRYAPPPGPPDGDLGVSLEIGDRVVAYLKMTGERTYELSCDVGCLVKLP